MVAKVNLSSSSAGGGDLERKKVNNSPITLPKTHLTLLTKLSARFVLTAANEEGDEECNERIHGDVRKIVRERKRGVHLLTETLGENWLTQATHTHAQHTLHGAIERRRRRRREPAGSQQALQQQGGREGDEGGKREEKSQQGRK